MNTSQILSRPATPALRAFLADEAIQPLGFRRDGRPIYPIAGGAPDGGDGGNTGATGGDGGGQNGSQGAGDGSQGAGDGSQGGQQQTSGTGGQQGGDGAATGQQAGQAAGDTGASTTEKVEDLPDWAQKTIRDLRKESGDRRAQANTAETERTKLLDGIAQALGLKKGDETPTPEQLASQLTDAQKQARQSTVELAVYRGASKHQGDPDALLDSRAFLTKVSDLDPAAKDFAAKVDTAIKEAVENNPKLKTGRAPGASSVDHAGGPGEQRRTSSKPMSIDSAVSSHYGTS